MYPDYVSLVVGAYEKKKASNTLSPRLARPTSAKLKKECLDVCMERFHKKDEKTLRTFFGITGDARAHFQAIEKCDPDKFKPLINFLNKKTTSTDERNIELLAWLINFEPRPFDWERKYVVDYQYPSDAADQPNEQEEVKLTALGRGQGLKTLVNADQEIRIQKSKLPSWAKNLIIAAGALGVFGVTGFIFMDMRKPKTASTGQACMYWQGDHYEAISCNQKLNDAIVLALDSTRLLYFKRITSPDTITHRSVGKVWYIKIKNQLEYYTSGGPHPVNMQLQLKPLTHYMINKHLQKTNTVDKN